MKVLDSFKLKDFILKNRIIFSSPKTKFNPLGKIDEKTINFYKNRSKDVGLIISEPIRIDGNLGLGKDRELKLHDAESKKDLKKLIEAVQKEDTKFICRLYHSGREDKPGLIDNRTPISDEEMEVRFKDIYPKDLAHRGIHVIINKFALSSFMAKSIGANGIEVDASGGNLLSKFLSPLWNERNDIYGGNIYNNLNILKEIIEAIRQFCGLDFFISVRINASDFIDGGFSLTDSKFTIKALETFKIDAVNISYGTDKSIHYMFENEKFKENWNLDMIRELASETSLPIIAKNNVKSVSGAEKLINSTKIDLVSISRELVADENFIKNSLNNMKNKCIYCNNCSKTWLEDKSLDCPVNNFNN